MGLFNCPPLTQLFHRYITVDENNNEVNGEAKVNDDVNEMQVDSNNSE